MKTIGVIAALILALGTPVFGQTKGPTFEETVRYIRK
jgi:hypothetical protein